MRKPKAEEEFESINELRKREVLETFNANPDMAFMDLFKIFPKTAFSLECGLHPSNFPKKIENPDSIRMEEIFKIADYFGIEPEDIFGMIIRSIRPVKKASSSKKK